MAATIIPSSPVSISTQGLIALANQARSLRLTDSRVMALQAGDYQSRFKGRGMEYDESRPYQNGDDIRNIDWRVTARTGKAHTKLFCEERERPVIVWVDYRAPMFFATKGKYKSVIASELASLIAWAAVQKGDRIGGLIFSETQHEEIKPARGKTAALRLIHHLVDNPAWQQDKQVEPTVLSDSLLRVKRIAKPGSKVFLLSDFRYFDDIAETHLMNIAKHCDVSWMHIFDPLEQELPPAGKYRLSNGEHEIEISTFNKEYRNNYTKRFLEQQAYLQNVALRGRMHYQTCQSNEDPFTKLRNTIKNI